jgi:hypothetical protein
MKHLATAAHAKELFKQARDAVDALAEDIGSAAWGSHPFRV